jgi:hypothetical protein
MGRQQALAAADRSLHGEVVHVQDRDRIRALAEEVAVIAASPENEAVKSRWRAVNGLRKPDRPPVWCRPVGAWNELLPNSHLVCREPQLRQVERFLRMILIKHEIGDDSPVEDYFPIEAVFDVEPATVWGLPVGRHHPEEAGGAWAYDPPLRAAEDFARLRIPRYTFNRARTEEKMAWAAELLGDVLPVRLQCSTPLSATLCTYAAELRGLTEMMLDMAAEPDLMHRLMAHLRDGVLQAMQDVAATGLLTPNNHGPMTCSEPIGPPQSPLTYRNLWVMTNSQEFDQVSPAMWQEFCLQYQLPIIEQFGLSAYGCCENLTHKIDGVLSIPNLRIFVCSAWTHLPTVVERVGDKYVIMWRQKASDVVYARDEADLKAQLENGLRQLRGCYVQIVLRELQTLAGDLKRLHKWTRLAIEAASRYS